VNGLRQNAVLRARVAALSLVTLGVLGARPPLRWTAALGGLAVGLGAMEVAAARAARRRAGLAAEGEQPGSMAA
jgi:hypothetical protein